METILDPIITKTFLEAKLSLRSRFAPERTLYYLGLVNYATTERVLNGIAQHMQTYGTKELYLVVTSAGGPSGTAMSFYGTVRMVLKPTLATIGAGDIDSSGLIIFLAGTNRTVTPHTTALLHKAGRIFGSSTRYTAKDLQAMATEDELKDKQYAEIVATNSGGKLTPKKVLHMMEKKTVLSADELVAYGLAHALLE